MQRELVEERRWIGPQRFLHALNYCIATTRPRSPTARRLHRLAAQRPARRPGGRQPVRAPRHGRPAGPVGRLRRLGGRHRRHRHPRRPGPAVVAVVAHAVLRVGGRALGHPALVAVAVGAFVALALFGVAFPVVVAAAAAVGWLLGRLAPHTLTSKGKGGPDADGPPPLIPDQALHAERPSLARTLRIRPAAPAPGRPRGGDGRAAAWVHVVIPHVSITPVQRDPRRCRPARNSPSTSRNGSLTSRSTSVLEPCLPCVAVRSLR
jgi:chromate transporter